MTAPVYQRPATGEHLPYFSTYIDQVTEADVLGLMASQVDEVKRFFEALPPARADYAYAPGKWTPKEILGHMTDTERVMTYRALAFSRNDPSPLPSFDENAWVPPAGFGRRSVASLLDEWIAVRRASLAFFNTLLPEATARRGTASNHTLSVRAVAYIITGHVRHHLRVLRERYLAGA